MESRIVQRRYPVTVAVVVVVVVAVAVTSVPAVEGGKLGTLFKKTADTEKIKTALTVLDKLKPALDDLRMVFKSLKESPDDKKTRKRRRNNSLGSDRPMLEPIS